MAKKGKGGNQEKKKEETKAKSAMEQILTLVASGALGDEAKQKVADTLSGDAGFLSWWQRKSGESFLSTQNVLKAIGLIGGYTLYDHADPFEGSKADNAAALLASIALGVLLVVPQSNELGAHFHNFEADIFLLLQKVEDEEEKEKILRWIRGLSNRQEGRFAGLACGLLKTTEGTNAKEKEERKEALLKLLKSEKMRNAIKDLLGEDAPPTSFEESVKKAKKIVKKYWPQAKGSLAEADRQIAGKLHGLRLWLEGKGVK